jgi:Alpha/beta hydrolase domain
MTMSTRGVFARCAMTVLLALSLSVSLAEARVVRFVVEQQRSFASGVAWGRSGPYERLDGTAYMEVDPHDPLNAVIVNLDKAPRNAQGMVEFSSPFFILKPVDMARGNHKLFYGINNRGNKLEITQVRAFPSVPSANNNDPLTAADVGDGFLLRLGYAIVDAGWQGDVAAGNNRLFPNLPVATQPDGSPIVAAVRIEYTDRTIPDAGTFTLTLEGNPAFRSYETADTNTAHSTLTVRSEVDGPKVPIPSDRWAFGQCPTGAGSLVPTPTDICLFDGFRADQLYELIYPAKNPMVMGLGYAVTRDIGSFLRYQTEDDAGNPNPLAHLSDRPGHHGSWDHRDSDRRDHGKSRTGIRRAYSSGTSSTGMYQRDWLYLGFNEDESHRKVFDGVHIIVSGTHRLFANVEFADPNTYSRQDDRHDFLSYSHPPLTFAVTTDPISGIHDGILKRPATDPLVFEIDGEAEVWQFRATLNVTDGLGHPVPVPDNVRLYFNSGFSHVRVAGLLSPAGPPGICQNPTHQSFLGIGPTFRALTIALDEWAERGIKPPKSNYPRVQDKTLVTLDEYRAAFPAIPGAAVPTVLNELELLDFGPEFNSEGGRLTLLPPVLGPSYQLFVPKPDKDGVDIAGIRPMQIRAPLGTNTGWNVRAPGHRGPNLCGPSTSPGSFIPFATTKAERLAAGDPRKSLEERYKDHDGFVKAVMYAAKHLVHERFLLEEDAETFIRAAEASDVLK